MGLKDKLSNSRHGINSGHALLLTEKRACILKIDIHRLLLLLNLLENAGPLAAQEVVSRIYPASRFTPTCAV